MKRVPRIGPRVRGFHCGAKPRHIFPHRAYNQRDIVLLPGRKDRGKVLRKHPGIDICAPSSLGCIENLIGRSLPERCDRSRTQLLAEFHSDFLGICEAGTVRQVIAALRYSALEEPLR